MGFSHHAHSLVTPGHPFLGSRLTAAVTATAAATGYQQPLGLGAAALAGAVANIVLAYRVYRTTMH
jgi:hypothetical protein